MNILKSLLLTLLLSLTQISNAQEPQFPLTNNADNSNTTNIVVQQVANPCLTGQGYADPACVRAQELIGKGMNPREAYAVAMSEYPKRKLSGNELEAREYLRDLQMLEFMRLMSTPMVKHAMRQIMMQDPRLADALWEVERMEIIEQMRRDMPEPKE